MRPTAEQVSELLRQRRNTRPDEAYWQDFLQEFHHNLRIKNTSKSATPLWMDGLKAWLAEIKLSRWAYTAGLAYVTATMAFLLLPRNAVMESIPSTPVHHQVVPTPSYEQLEQLDLNPFTEGHAGEQTF